MFPASLTAGHQPAPEAPLQVSFVPTPRDQVTAVRSIQRSGRWARLAEVAFPLLILVNMLFVASDSGWRGVFSGFALVFPIALAVWLLRGPMLLAATQLQWRKNPHLVGPHLYLFSDDAVVLRMPHRELRMEWSGILRAVETRGQYLLFIAQRAAYFVPKRALREADEARLRGLLLQRLEARARLKPISARS